MSEGHSTRCHVLGFGMVSWKTQYFTVQVIIEQTAPGEEEGGVECEADGVGGSGDVEFGKGGVEISPEFY